MFLARLLPVCSRTSLARFSSSSTPITAPSSSVAPCGVFWDIENVCLPSGPAGHRFIAQVKAKVAHPIAFIRAYEPEHSGWDGSKHWTGGPGEEERIMTETAREGVLRMNDVSIVKFRGRTAELADTILLADMQNFAIDHPEAPICLVSGDNDFSMALHQLRNRGHKIILFTTHKMKFSTISAADEITYIGDRKGDPISTGVLQHQQVLRLLAQQERQTAAAAQPSRPSPRSRSPIKVTKVRQLAPSHTDTDSGRRPVSISNSNIPKQANPIESPYSRLAFTPLPHSIPSSSKASRSTSKSTSLSSLKTSPPSSSSKSAKSLTPTLKELARGESTKAIKTRLAKEREREEKERRADRVKAKKEKKRAEATAAAAAKKKKGVTAGGKAPTRKEKREANALVKKAEALVKKAAATLKKARGGGGGKAAALAAVLKLPDRVSPSSSKRRSPPVLSPIHTIISSKLPKGLLGASRRLSDLTASSLILGDRTGRDARARK